MDDFKPYLLSVFAIVSIETMKTLDSYVSITMQWVIGFLTVVYLIYKIKHLKNEHSAKTKKSDP